MKKYQTVPVATGGQIKELASALVEAIPRGLSFEDAQYWVGRKGKLANEMRKIFIQSNSNEHFEVLSFWQNFYKELGLKLDLSNLVIPEKPSEGNWRLLVIADLALETLYAKCKGLFPCWLWTNDNLDKKVIYNERDAKNGSYAIWVKDEMEADEKYKNLSANQIKGMNIKTETLAERLIHELKHFKETGKHLDIKNITLCSGSRYSDGSVPFVDWSDDDKLYVYWYFPDDSSDNLRAREAVSN